MEKYEAVEYIHQALKAQHSPEAIVAELCRRTGAPADLMSTFVAREIVQVRAKESASRAVLEASAPDPLNEPAAPALDRPAFAAEADAEQPPGRLYARTSPFVLPPESNHYPIDQEDAAGVNRAEIPGITDPRSPLSNPEQEAELTRKVVKKLQGHVSESDVIMLVCEEAGMSWAEANQFVNKVAQENRRAIQGRLNLILIPMGAGVLIGGLAFFINGLEGIISLYQVVVVQSPDAVEASMSFSYRDFILAGTGLAMIAGGSFGLFQSFKSFWE